MVAPIEDFGGNSFSKFIVHSKKNLLNLKDVQVLKHYPYLIEETPNAERLRKLTYSLPIDPYLEDEELSKIVDAINHMPT
jgi:dTDP-4-amino-4,6-dideoxygalactose transaminase